MVGAGARVQTMQRDMIKKLTQLVLVSSTLDWARTFSHCAYHSSLMRKLHDSRSIRVKRLRVIIFALTSVSFLDVLAEHSSLFFPTSLILTNRLKIQTFSIHNIHGEKLQEKTPCEPARWIGMFGKLANRAPNTVLHSCDAPTSSC